MINLVIIVSFLGLVFGYLLSFMAKEEIVFGKKYFILVEKLLLFLLAVSLLYFAWGNYLLMFLFFILGVGIGFVFRKVYFYLGLALFLSFLFSSNFILLISSLVFIFGIFYGSYNIKKVKFLFLNLLFFIVPFLLFFVKDFILVNKEILLAFTAGALLFRK